VPGEIQQINVRPQTKGEHGLPKMRVDSAFVARAGVEGDFNVYRHKERRDDPDQALLIMPIETIKELNSEGWPIKPGDLGENFTTRGIPYQAFGVGRFPERAGHGFRLRKRAILAITCFCFLTSEHPRDPASSKSCWGGEGGTRESSMKGRSRLGIV